MRAVNSPQEMCCLVKVGKILMTVLTPSFLSLSRAPCRKSLDTSSFSSNHMMTNGSNQLQKKKDGAGTESESQSQR